MGKVVQWMGGGLSLLLLAGCVESDDASDRGEVPRGLVLSDRGDVVVGSFADEDRSMRFRSEITEDGFAVEIVFNGMTLEAVVDESGVLEHDGYASENGEPTQMTDDDREALVVLTEVLEEEGAEVGEPLRRLRGFANVWSEYPSTMELKGAVATNFRSYTSICQHLDTYQQATHDDWDYDRWDDETTYYGYVSMHAAGPCSGGTYFWNNNQWQCYEPDHSTTVEYAYGNCFGRCGGGCGSATQFTWDCHDHDSCVRFGHDIASFWCNDEFSATIDDWASAPDCL